MDGGAFQSLRDLELSRDEVDRLGTALKDEKFRKLFADYVEEVNSPESRKVFQDEMRELERERGVDVTFINPLPGYVVKTSVNGSQKAFVNVCANENVGKPSSSPTTQDGARGLQWSLPHSLAPPREDIDNKKAICRVYDVVFHPDTLHLANNNTAFKNMVNRTACEAVENNFDVTLDCRNLKFPKLLYKGIPQPAVIRKPSVEKPPEKSPEDQAFLDKIFQTYPKPSSPRKSPVKKPVDITEPSNYTTPKYLIKHRSHLELEEFTFSRDAKQHTATPKELIIEINLPLIKSASDITLDVAEKSVQLISEKPAKYKLSVTLPYLVNQDSGNAKFDKDLKKLIVTLPVKRSTFTLSDLSRDDSGVESDHGSPVSTPSLEKIVEIEPEMAFLDSNTHYILPEHTCHLNDDDLTFTLNVKNVNEASIVKTHPNTSSIHIKLQTISSGFFPVHYAFYLNLPISKIEENEITIEVWDNNVVLQINGCKGILSYYVGVNESDLINKKVNTSSDDDEENDDLYEAGEASVADYESKFSNLKLIDVSNSIAIKKPPAPSFTRSTSLPSDFTHKPQKANKILDSVPLKTEPSRSIDIIGAHSESSGDELSCSYSPSKCKGILKRMSGSRSSVSRSISESSIDDLLWASSFENCYNSMDSVIPEDGEVSASLKKTVRFNDNVTRQLFRSNSSILGQKKKNQRKARNKKRAQDHRRHSESEVSESEEKKERDGKTNGNNGADKFLKSPPATPSTPNDGSKEDNHIFDFDM